jgi:hypothetical protein
VLDKTIEAYTTNYFEWTAAERDKANRSRIERSTQNLWKKQDTTGFFSSRRGRYVLDEKFVEILLMFCNYSFRKWIGVRLKTISADWGFVGNHRLYIYHTWQNLVKRWPTPRWTFVYDRKHEESHVYWIRYDQFSDFFRSISLFLFQSSVAMKNIDGFDKLIQFQGVKGRKNRSRWLIFCLPAFQCWLDILTDDMNDVTRSISSGHKALIDAR